MAFQLFCYILFIYLLNLSPFPTNMGKDLEFNFPKHTKTLFTFPTPDKSKQWGGTTSQLTRVEGLLFMGV